VKNRFIVVVFAAVGIGALLTVPACSNQGEGERCNVQGDNFGRDECQDNMRCTPANELTGSTTDRCCPDNRAQAQTAICSVPTNRPDQSNAPPSDAATVIDAGPTDGGSGANSDAAVDAADAD